MVKVPQEGEVLYFSGAREGAVSLEEGTDAAMQAARAHAAEYIGVDVSSEHRDVMSTDLLIECLKRNGARGLAAAE